MAGVDGAAQSGPRPGSGEMFDGIAPRYDALNRILSLGMDQRWRRLTVESLQLFPGARVLDLATGTGDLALALLRAEEVRLTGLDPSSGMLRQARKKLAAAGTSADLLRGDACRLPFASAGFERVCIGFGIRNFPDRLSALREIRRVLVPAGRLAILELVPPGRGALAPLSRFWVRSAVPWIGARLSGRGEYRYLEQSVSAFPPPEVFSRTIEEAGFEMLGRRLLGFGACCLYVARPRL
ncbi:MAG: ubiquinone/menaquinone biosynthesis methyltransferase [Myxococcota bacterium]